MKTLGSCLAAAILLSTGTAAAQNLQITGFTHAGEGCPAGGLTHLFNPATRTLSLVFDDYEVSLDPDGTGNPSAACNIDAVVRSSAPARISWKRVAQFGYIDKPTGVTAELRRRYQYDVNPPVSKVRTWPASQRVRGWFLVSDELPGQSSCRSEVTAGMTSRMTLRGRPARPARMVIDRLTTGSRMDLAFDVQPCQQ